MARKQPNGLDLVSTRIIHVADGSASDDAATWGQVQAFLNGLAWKPAVRAASTATVTVSSPGASIDGVSLANGDRVLLKNQSTGSENGVYVWTASGSALTRATDMDSAAKTKSATVWVQEGTANADTEWTQTADSVTLGTTTLTFVQVNASGTTYTAGTNGGLQLSAGAFSVKLPGSSGLTTDSTGLHIDTSIVTRKFAANYGDGSTTSITITHNLGTLDVVWRAWDVSSGVEEDPDVTHATTNTLTIGYAVAPASNAKRIVVIG